MKLVVGLGNPGREHEATRHNAGFWWVDRLAARVGARLRPESRFHGYAGKLVDGGRRMLAAQAHHIHECQRSRGAGAHAVLQDRRRPTCWSCTMSSICRRATSGSKRVAVRQATMASRTSLRIWDRISGGCASASAGRAIATQMVNFVLNAPRKEEHAADRRGHRAQPRCLAACCWSKSEAAMLNCTPRREMRSVIGDGHRPFCPSLFTLITRSPS